MNAKKASEGNRGFWGSWKGGTIGLGAALAITLSFVLPDVLSSETASTAAHAKASGVARGAGLPVGSLVPSFSGRDLRTGMIISSHTVSGEKTLIFFSEGATCQACFEQIRGLQRAGNQLARRGIQLISITPDSPGDLRQAAQQYSITTRLISDSNRAISRAFNTLGQGMHGDAPGHAFVLAYHGKVLWYRDYWLAPHPAMYVAPEKLLADIPKA